MSVPERPTYRKTGAAFCLYEALRDSGCEIDNHESDLYTPVTETSRKIVRESGCSFATFTSQIDGRLWYDVPFAFSPWWERRQARVGADNE